MSWLDAATADSLSWLLEPDSPGVRYLALRDLLDRPEDDAELRAARRAAHAEGPIATVLAGLEEAGYWVTPGPGYNPKYRSTVWSITLLAQLGASVVEDERVARACSYLLDHALAPGGQFSYSGAAAGTFDCLQGNLCWALTVMGFDDPRLGQAFEWMARSVTGEGVGAVGDRGSPVRYYGIKCGPLFACSANDRQPCAWGAVKVMLALGRVPAGRRTKLVDDAIDSGAGFLLGVDPVTAAYPTPGGNKPSTSWRRFGFPLFYVTDVLQIVEALVGLGYGQDPRLANALSFVRGKQDERGRWPLEYDYAGKTWVEFGAKKQPNKWVTLRALRALKTATGGG